MTSVPISKSRRLAVLEKHNWTCAYCGQPLSYELIPTAVEGIFISPEGYEYPTVDHIVPKSRGGNNTLDNLAACCSRCNSSKNCRVLEEWR